MHVVRMDDIMQHIEDESATQIPPPRYPDVGDIFGEPQVLPRIETKYQAEIPLLVAEFDQLQVIDEPAELDVVANLKQSFLLGLAIPLMWADCEVVNFNRIVEFGK